MLRRWDQRAAWLDIVTRSRQVTPYNGTCELSDMLGVRQGTVVLITYESMIVYSSAVFRVVRELFIRSTLATRLLIGW